MANFFSSLLKWATSFPPAEWLDSQIQNLCLKALSQGPIPEHVAFVMDGNRRFARAHNIETIEGHHQGSVALANILSVCYELGVKVITVYAFSIENYRRPKFEVDGLMQLLKSQVESSPQVLQLLDKYGAAIRFVGRRDLIRPDVLEAITKIEERTKHNKMSVLNLCFAYTSREEIATAIRTTVQDFTQRQEPENSRFSQSRITQTLMSKQLSQRNGLPIIPEPATLPTPTADSDEVEQLVPLDSPPSYYNNETPLVLPDPENINVDYINEHMYLHDPPVEIFIRTSGVQRMSDFLMWQSHEHTHISFIEKTWPEMRLSTLLPIILEWQWKQKQRARDRVTTKGRHSKVINVGMGVTL